LSFQQDLMLLSSARQVCDEGSDYACFRQDEAYYDIVPLDRAGGEIQGGLAPATSRILIGYDRVFGEHLSVGVRAGYAFRGGPQAPGGNAFVPIHGEARLSYWFGTRPFARSGVRPFVQASGGIAQVDTQVSVKVFDEEQVQRRELSAWRKAGTGFASVGGGAAFAVTANHALVAELRLMQLLGVGGTALGLNAGYALGL
jgi:hypothetical protein